MRQLILPLLIILLSCKLSQAQNVGIGTQAPKYPFTVYNRLIGISQQSGTIKPVAIGFYTDSVTGGAFLQTHTKNNLLFATNDGGAAMVLDTLGRVGIGLAIPAAKLDVGGKTIIRDTLKLTYGSPGAGKVLISDAAGNASWQLITGALTKISSEWKGPVDAPSRDSSIDGTLTKVYYVAAPELTANHIATASISVYFRVGPVGPYELPYISNAGGRANAIQAILLPGKIAITRPTFNETAPNNINLPATLEFRYTIIQ